MTNAPRDNNNIPSKLGVLNTDTVQGTTLVPIAISPITNSIVVDEISEIAFTMLPVAPKDGNYVNCWLFQGTDGLTYPAVVNSDGGLLVNSA